MSESCPEGPLQRGAAGESQSWVSLGFPVFKEAVISGLQEPWGLLSQRAKRDIDQWNLDVISIFCLCVRGQHPDQEGPIPSRMYVYAVQMCARPSPLLSSAIHQITYL